MLHGSFAPRFGYSFERRRQGHFCKRGNCGCCGGSKHLFHRAIALADRLPERLEEGRHADRVHRTEGRRKHLPFSLFKGRR